MCVCGYLSSVATWCSQGEQGASGGILLEHILMLSPRILLICKGILEQLKAILK